MKKLLNDLLAPLYLGGALAVFGGIHYYQWKFYAIIIPFYILAKLTKFNQDS